MTHCDSAAIYVLFLGALFGFLFALIWQWETEKRKLKNEELERKEDELKWRINAIYERTRAIDEFIREKK